MHKDREKDWCEYSSEEEEEAEDVKKKGGGIKDANKKDGDKERDKDDDEDYVRMDAMLAAQMAVADDMDDDEGVGLATLSPGGSSATLMMSSARSVDADGGGRRSRRGGGKDRIAGIDKDKKNKGRKDKGHDNDDEDVGSSGMRKSASMEYVEEDVEDGGNRMNRCVDKDKDYTVGDKDVVGRKVTTLSSLFETNEDLDETLLVSRSIATSSNIINNNEDAVAAVNVAGLRGCMSLSPIARAGKASSASLRRRSTSSMLRIIATAEVEALASMNRGEVSGGDVSGRGCRRDNSSEDLIVVDEIEEEEKQEDEATRMRRQMQRDDDVGRGDDIDDRVVIVVGDDCDDDDDETSKGWLTRSKKRIAVDDAETAAADAEDTYAASSSIRIRKDPRIKTASGNRFDGRGDRRLRRRRLFGDGEDSIREFEQSVSEDVDRDVLPLSYLFLLGHGSEYT